MGYDALSRYRSELMGLAMLWVMLYHAWELDLFWAPLNALRAIGFGGVDIFILLSAMGLCMSLDRREQRFGTYLARRAARIGPAYYAVMVPSTLAAIVRGTAPVSALFWNATLLSYWLQTEGSFNWYVSGIMTLYVLAWPCFHAMRRTRHRAAAAALGVAASLALCALLIRRDWWSYLGVPYRLPIFFLGLLMGFYAGEGRKIGARDVCFWCAWTACGVGYFVLAVREIVKVIYLPPSLVLVFAVLPACLAVCALFRRLPLGALRRFLRLVGERSLEIYLLNVTLFAQPTPLRRYLDVGPGHWVYYLCVFAANILCAALLHRVIEGLRRRFRAWRERRAADF